MLKRAIVDQIIEQLLAELEGYGRSARAAHSEATHEQNKAENKYDTRALEASYLAHGQSRQALETEEAIRQFQNLPLRDFASGDAIDLGALVELEAVKARGERTLFFIGPRAGGTEITVEGKTILVLTTPSPMGRELIGKKAGARIRLQGRGPAEEFRVASVS